MQDRISIHNTLDDARGDPSMLQHTISTLMQDGGPTAKYVREWIAENPSALTPTPVTLRNVKRRVFSRRGDPYSALVEESAIAALN